MSASTLGKSIFFIGAGSMAEAIIKGLVTSAIIAPQQIYVTNQKNHDRLVELREKYGVELASSIQQGCELADVIVLAVKPWAIKDVTTELAAFLNNQQILISVAAGITTEIIETIIKQEIPVIRTMPNTSSAICESATGICKGKYVNAETLHIAEKIFETIGKVAVVEESQMDAVTGLSGSGPAYIYYLIEGMEKAGVEAGLSQEVSRELVVQTVYGAAKMLLETKAEPAILRQQVTSPNGTTAAGLQKLEDNQFHDILYAAVARAKERAGEIGKELEATLWNTK
ncbi:pyrroline-5-carboxylate reductase [Desulfuribacillus stibiiarsenatis]|uniref:Pyrroline-5-carboxylate reductase n=1 Tax=Desulfuribacillus stibiiarsenatis TaxID=1390249 RepID=A0A1E5L2V6_9FIRM|nr:pyrroline-5-carboxylate reductase [Desulfuribacillus stibiiarsenatis]OEH84414.1 pyrroline-5-carboxylate reductase [Desulfuribacillus stibiiarsenatis]